MGDTFEQKSYISDLESFTSPEYKPSNEIPLKSEDVLGKKSYESNYERYSSSSKVNSLNTEINSPRKETFDTINFNDMDITKF